MEQRAMEKREEGIQAQRKEQEKEQAREAFTNPWLIGMETRMTECNRQLEGTEDAEMRAVLTSMLEIVTLHGKAGKKVNAWARVR